MRKLPNFSDVGLSSGRPLFPMEPPEILSDLMNKFYGSQVS